MKAIGLDIGTTTICAIVVDAQSGEVVKSVTLPNDSFVEQCEKYEKIQDPKKILDKSLKLVDGMLEEYDDIACIGVTGQMHGIVYLDKNGNPLSNLYIWQDASGNEMFKDGKTYAEYLSALTGYKMASGFGCTTYFVHTQKGSVPDGTDAICTIHDFVAMKLAQINKPVMHISDAASFGLFDIEKQNFDYCAAKKAGLNENLFPEVTAENRIIGKRNGTIPVSVAIGDNQASFIGSVDNLDNSLLVNVGTGSQISFSTKEKTTVKGLEIRPCAKDRMICVGSSLCGGRAFALLENFFRMTAEMVVGEKVATAYKGMDNLLLSTDKVENPLDFSTLFCGTRDNPDERASVSGIGIDNFTPSHFIFGVLDGMAQELYSMYESGVSSTDERPAQLVASGNGIRKNKTLQRIISDKFGMTLKIPKHREEAAFGSVIFSLTSSKIYDTIQSAQLLIKYE